jgi:hypothetical protein
MYFTYFYLVLTFHVMQVVISQMNGQDHASHSVHVFNVGKMRIKLCRGWITKAREIYSMSMLVKQQDQLHCQWVCCISLTIALFYLQLCGVRTNSNTAAKSLFWQPRKGLSFVLTFNSERDRNAAIMLARKYAYDCNGVPFLFFLFIHQYNHFSITSCPFPWYFAKKLSRPSRKPSQLQVILAGPEDQA